MKTFILIAILLFSFNSKAEQYFKFSYKTSDELSITVPANSRAEAFSKASKKCFEILSKGIYMGEDAGLDAIDICVNPK